MLFSSVFVITERSDMGLYEVPLSMSLLDFGMGTIVNSVNSSFQHAHEECESKRAPVF